MQTNMPFLIPTIRSASEFHRIVPERSGLRAIPPVGNCPPPQRQISAHYISINRAKNQVDQNHRMCQEVLGKFHPYTKRGGAADKKLDSDGGYYDVIFIRAETKSLAAV